MSQITAVIIVLAGAFAIALITAGVVRKSGYSFWRFFISGFLMGAGILGIIMKILLDYL